MKEIFGVKSNYLERSRHTGADTHEMNLRRGKKGEGRCFGDIAFEASTGLELLVDKPE